MLPLFSSDIIWKKIVRWYGLKKNHTNSLDKNQLDFIGRQSRSRVDGQRKHLVAFALGKALQQGQPKSNISPWPATDGFPLKGGTFSHHRGHKPMGWDAGSIVDQLN